MTGAPRSTAESFRFLKSVESWKACLASGARECRISPHYEPAEAERGLARSLDASASCPAARRLPEFALGLLLPLHEPDDHRVAVPDHLAENFLTRGQELAGMRRQTSATHVVLDLSCPPLHAGSCIGDLKIDPIKLGRAGPLTLPCG